MSQQPPLPPRFFSLRWKSAIVLLLLLTTTFGLLTWRVYLHTNKLFNEQLDSSKQRQAQLFTALLKQSEQTMSGVIATALATDQPTSKNQSTAGLSGKSKDQYLSRLEKKLTANWHFLSKHWNLNSLLLFDRRAQIVMQNDTTDPANLQTIGKEMSQWITQVGQTKEGLTTIICQDHCLQYVAAPISVDTSLVGVLLVSRDINHTLGAFKALSDTDIGIIKPSQSTKDEPDISHWNAKLIALSNAPTRLPVLRYAAERIKQQDAFQQRLTLSYENQAFTLYLSPLPETKPRGTHLVFLKEASDKYKWLTRGRKEYLLLSIIGILLLIFYFNKFSSRILNPIKQQTQVLSLLGQKKYREARRRVQSKRKPHSFANEVDVLNEATITLSFQLESLEKSFGVHTQEMERRSLFDPLTGLANRNLFQFEVQQDSQRLKQQDSLLAVILLDLDKFKRINDSLGHQQGDMLLGKIGERLKQATRTLGLVSRLGGDEFALLIRNAKKYAQIEILSKKIVDLIHKPIKLNQSSVVVTCSVGVSIAGEAETANDLLRKAEIAMYKAKEAGGDTYQIFNTVMADETHNTLSLENEIRRALENDEFTLYLQPKVNMDSGVEGFESLVRWDHPDRGILPPGEFIPAMESIGIISQLDNWVLEASCRQLKTWQEHYPGITLAVNISSTHFTDRNFLAFLQECLHKYPISPSLLELEITETLLMENMNIGLEIITQIKELGVSIAIDDFGTGYSSLSYLKKLPVDTLKIDRVFIKDIPESASDMQISSVIIFLAKQLNFKVVAEGVETSEQFVFLKTNQCDLAQGFYFSKPIPAHKAMIVLESQRLSEQTTTAQL